MNKKTGIIVAVCVIAAIIIGGAVWYFAAGNNSAEMPENAQSVSNDVTQTQDGQAPEIGEETETQAPEAGKEPQSQAPATNEESTAQEQETSAQETTQASGEQTKKVKPTFVYFVTNADMKNDKVTKALDDLKAEYGDRVVFDIRNVDEDPALLESFSFVKGKTPALIMHNTDNNMCRILVENAELSELKEAIEIAFQS